MPGRVKTLLLCGLVMAGCADARGGRHHGHRFFNDVEAGDDSPKLPGARHEHHGHGHKGKGFSMKDLCKADADKLCGSHEDGDRAAKDALGSCLEANVAKIQDAKCKAVTAKRVACKDDVKKFCRPEEGGGGKGAGGKGKGGGQHGGRGLFNMKCLAEHADKLSKGCKAAQPCLADMKKHCSQFKHNLRWQWKCLAGVSSKKLTPKCNKEVAGWKAKKAKMVNGARQATVNGTGSDAAVPHRRRLALSGDTKALLVGLLAGVLSTLCVLLMYKQCSGMRGGRSPPGVAFNKVSNEEDDAHPLPAACPIATAYPVAGPVGPPPAAPAPAAPPPSYSSLREETVAPASAPTEAAVADPPSFHRGAVLSSHTSFTKSPTSSI